MAGLRDRPSAKSTSVARDASIRVRGPRRAGTTRPDRRAVRSEPSGARTVTLAASTVRSGGAGSAPSSPPNATLGAHERTHRRAVHDPQRSRTSWVSRHDRDDLQQAAVVPVPPATESASSPTRWGCRAGPALRRRPIRRTRAVRTRGAVRGSRVASRSWDPAGMPLGDLRVEDAGHPRRRGQARLVRTRAVPVRMMCRGDAGPHAPWLR